MSLEDYKPLVNNEIIAREIKQKKQKNYWKIGFIVLICILAVVGLGYTGKHFYDKMLESNFNEGIKEGAIKIMELQQQSGEIMIYNGTHIIPTPITKLCGLEE